MTAHLTVHGSPFCAAHSGLHGGRFEPLHGHTYRPRLHVTGRADSGGMVVDFRAAKTALAAAAAPLHGRTLMPGQAPGVRWTRDDDRGEIAFTDGHRRFLLPVDDVVVLPVSNTSTELIATHILEQIRSVLPEDCRAELVVAESPTAEAAAVWEDGVDG